MNVASYIDHTILKPTTVPDDIKKLCNEAIEFKFAAVCVPPPYVKISKDVLKGCDIKIATVAGFPFGYSSARAKLCEVEQSIEDGADELDIVVNISSIKSAAWKQLETEIKMLISPIHLNNRIVKVIIESGILTDNEIIKCCELYSNLGTDFLKTSTGYAETGATLHAVQLMRHHLPSGIKIKASGGIRTFEAVKQFIEAGADRIGCSASIAIIKQQHAMQ